MVSVRVEWVGGDGGGALGKLFGSQEAKKDYIPILQGTLFMAERDKRMREGRWGVTEVGK